MVCNLVNAQELTLFINISQIRRQFLPVCRIAKYQHWFAYYICGHEKTLTNPLPSIISKQNELKPSTHREMGTDEVPFFF